MKKNLTFVSHKYNHGFTLWLKVDNKKIMLESAIKTEEELNDLIASMSNLNHFKGNWESKHEHSRNIFKRNPFSRALSRILDKRIR